MMAFMLTVSLILNMVCLLAITLLFLRQNRLMDVERMQKKSLAELEDLLASFVMEMKEDNEQFLSHLDSKENSSAQQAVEVEKAEIVLKKDVSPVQEERIRPSAKQVKNAYSSAHEELEDLPPWIKLENEESTSRNDQQLEPKESKEKLPSSHIPTLQEQIVQYHQEGLSIEEIAKKLDKGKTEIELTLKFLGV